MRNLLFLLILTYAILLAFLLVVVYVYSTMK